MHVGVRVGELRFDAQYQLRTLVQDADSGMDGWGTLSLVGRALVRRFLSIELLASLQSSAVRGGVALSVYPTRKLEFGAGIGYSRSLFPFAEPNNKNALSGSCHIGYWIGRAVGLSIDYAVARYVPGAVSATHQLDLALTSRI
jgi:hypothetical protein